MGSRRQHCACVARRGQSPNQTSLVAHRQGCSPRFFRNIEEATAKTLRIRLSVVFTGSALLATNNAATLSNHEIEAEPQQNRHFPSAEFAAGERSAVPGNHLVVAIDQHRDIKRRKPECCWRSAGSASCYRLAGSRGQALVLNWSIADL